MALASLALDEIRIWISFLKEQEPLAADRIRERQRRESVDRGKAEFPLPGHRNSYALDWQKTPDF